MGATATRSTAGQDGIKVKVPFARWPTVKQQVAQFGPVPSQDRRICQYPANRPMQGWYDTMTWGRAMPQHRLSARHISQRRSAILRVEQAAPANLFEPKSAKPESMSLRHKGGPPVQTADTNLNL